MCISGNWIVRAKRYRVTSIVKKTGLGHFHMFLEYDESGIVFQCNFVGQLYIIPYMKRKKVENRNQNLSDFVQWKIWAGCF